ncbi:hypothetical protein Aoki45_01020 [Algoriphagus sp. oki45]|uniref:O-antigen polymerase n=1 Tax=Algoriphagus sp. oki45 TaxID=3067294 RepID=UPI0027E7AD11|nr:hypothetical protein Aoki45_01020 [Algoriphagus sp. oki45]
MILANLITAFSLICFWIFWLRDQKVNKYIFSPVKLFIIASFIYLILPSIIIPNFFPVGLFWRINMSVIPLNHFVIFVFNFIFLFFFTLLSKLRFYKINFDFSNNALYLSVLFLILAIFAKVYMINSGLFFVEDDNMVEVVNVPRFIRLFNNLHLWGFMIITIMYFKTNYNPNISSFNKTKFIFYFYFLFTAIIPFLQGRRFGVLFPIIIVLSIYFIYNIISKRKIFIYSSIVFSIFLLMTLFRQAQIFSLSYYNSVDIFSIFKSISHLDNNFLVESFSSRLFNVYINLVRVIEFVESSYYTPFYNPFYLAFIGLIPSIFWSSKPGLSIGNALGKELSLIHQNNDLIGINIGWIGEGYYFAGIIGVIFSSLLFCVSIIFFYKIVNYQSDSGKIVILMYVIFLISGFQMELAFTFNSFFKGNFILLSLLFFSSRFKSIKI